MEAQVDQRFGRCPYFLIVDSETGDFEAVQNGAAGAMGGAGIQAAQSLVGKGVKVVITGNVGPNAYQTLSTTAIVIMLGASGTVKDTVERYKNGELHETKSPNVRGHSGMGRSMGRGQGQRRG